MTVILFLLLSFSAFAQDQYEYQLEGTFTASSEDPVIVNYSMSWNEAGTSLQGVYRDNYYSQNIPRVVSGTITEGNRNFTVTLPQEMAGVSVLRFSTPSSSVTGSTPMTIQTADTVENLVNSTSGFAIMTALPAAFEDAFTGENTCTVGFGSLTGFCGLYQGNINEFADEGNRCNLASGGNTRLELGTDTILRLHLNYLPGVSTESIHNIGAFLPTPVTNNINVSSTTCGPLAGTTFEPNCKQMVLAGSFSQVGDTFAFNGTYSIRDVVTGEICSYSMVLNRSGLL